MEIRETRVSRQSPPEPLDPAKIEFGRQCTPHFFRMDYAGGKWQQARIEPLSNFSLHPASNVFHYAQAIFEGLKGYRRADGQITLFRPEMNARRMNASAARMDMPDVDESLFLDAIERLVDLERDWVPPAPGTLYIRPAMIGTEPCLGVRGSTDFIFFILTLPTGAYFKGTSVGTCAVRVLVSESVARAAPGGTGNVKAAANYAVSLKTVNEAHKAGCGQVLFLDARGTRNVEELGGMNVLFAVDGKLVTPPLNDTTLAGVTRDSIVRMAPDLGLTVQERPITIDEVVSGIKNGRVTEAMACGTAAVVASIGSFKFENGTELKVGDGGVGPVASLLFDRLQKIQFGEAPDPYGWIRPVRSRVSV